MFARLTVMVAVLMVTASAVPSQALARNGAAPPKKSGKSRPGRAGTQRKAPKSKKRVPKNLAARALRTVIENAEFDDMTFEDVIDWLGRQTKASVVVRWKVLEAEGVERDAPISLKRRNLTIRKLLPLIFERATADLPEVKLAARADGNVLLISTRRDLNRKMIVRMYAVQDLLTAVPNFKGSHLDMDDIGRGGSGRMRGAVRGHRPDDATYPTGKLDARVRNLIAIITDTVEPESWLVHGGRGTISYFRGKLVVRNSLEVHQKIAGALTGRPASGDDRP
ncbi:MAG: hypothetical protein ACE5F9_05895 [Phycisphaerae bacterium]